MHGPQQSERQQNDSPFIAQSIICRVHTHHAYIFVLWHEARRWYGWLLVVGASNNNQAKTAGCGMPVDWRQIHACLRQLSDVFIEVGVEVSLFC